MDAQLTDSIKKWLETKPEDRDLEEGALLLLKLNRNAIMYRNMSFNLKRHAADIEYQLKKYYNFRTSAQITHEQVAEMDDKVQKIEKKHFAFSESVNNEEFKKGKRIDHDKLPKKIQQLYVDNLDILHKMRKIHEQLKMMSNNDKFPCHDSDRYPFLQEMIALDALMHKNWHDYDSYELDADERPTPAKKTKTVAKSKAKTTKKKTTTKK